MSFEASSSGYTAFSATSTSDGVGSVMLYMWTGVQESEDIRMSRSLCVVSLQ